MKYIMMLIHSDGWSETLHCKSLPEYWKVSKYIPVDGFENVDPSTVSSSLGEKIFNLTGKQVTGRLWWKKTYGFYAEKEVVGDFEKDVRNVREQDNGPSV